MFGPGDYQPDPTEKITHVDDLPKPKIVQRSRVRKKCACPLCQCPAKRHVLCQRSLRHLGNHDSGRPVEIRLQYSVLVS